MKSISRQFLALVGIAILTSASFAAAETLTRKEALQVTNILMQAKKVSNTYGGRYSGVTYPSGVSIHLSKAGGGKFEIRLEPNAPSINIDEILINDRPLRSLLEEAN
jgi:hypothetical protein